MRFHFKWIASKAPASKMINLLEGLQVTHFRVVLLKAIV